MTGLSLHATGNIVIFYFIICKFNDSNCNDNWNTSLVGFVVDNFMYVISCAIWYHLYNLKKVKNFHKGVLLLAEA